MKCRYKIVVTNQNFYKEIEISKDEKNIRIGTGTECDVRLRRDAFFEPIELNFINNDGVWSVTCSDNLYISLGDIRKLYTVEIRHGDTFNIKYQNSNEDVFKIEFLIDFDNGKIKYTSFMDVSAFSNLNIGNSESSDIIISGNYINPNDFIRLVRRENEWIIEDMKTEYGVYHNGQRAEKGSIIIESDFFSIAECFFYYKNNRLWFGGNISSKKLEIVTHEYGCEYPKFIRNTRVHTVVDKEKIEVLDPPAIPQKPKENIFMRLLPSLGMLLASGVMAAYGGARMLVFSGISACMSILIAVLNIREGKKDYKEKSEDRIKKYTKYIDDKCLEIEGCRETEKKALEEIYLDRQKELSLINVFSADLFDRNPEDEDFLTVMLGVGDSKANKEISYKKQERIEFDDELQMKPEEIAKKYEYVHDAPIICDLKESNAIGIVGYEEYRFEMFKNIVIDIATRHFYSDVKMFFVAEKENLDRIKWLRFLPHACDNETGFRFMVCDDDSRNNIFELLYKELSNRLDSSKKKPHIIIFFYDEYGFKSHPLSKFMEKAKELGITFIFFDDEKEQIPMGCDSIISIQDCQTAKIVETSDKSNTREFNYSEISNDFMKKFIDILSPVYTEEISLEGSLTKNISLFELMNIFVVDDINLKERWNTSKVFKSMAAPIGVSKTGVVSLDLHDKAHGPHGLVAGTTGSGKSEILQTYILMMATLFHPYEIGFLIIDFKGGGMVNQFKDLPHLLGAITNIDGKAINRSLKSIKAELQKRQRLFAEADVNHIDKYIKKYKAGETEVPLPHLIIIVDEFAELKAEQPDFMKELISAARIGRSLGVHLILATQKPAGQVDDQIWSNSRFKLCLKVQSQEDSNEVLKSPLAAEIKEPGRAYLQVGNNEIFELFQSAYSGAPEKMDDSKIKEFTLYELNDSGRKRPVYIRKKSKVHEDSANQLEAIVEYVSKYCKDNNISPLAEICLPPLPKSINYNNDSVVKDGVVDIGIFDDPDNQLQAETKVDISTKHTLIIGASQYGKTNLLQLIIRSIAASTTPREAVIYIIDFGSMVLKNFENLNHVGGVVCPSEDEKLKNLFKMLFKEITMRKEKLISVGVSSFSAYLEAGYNDIPHIYLMVDNLTALMELYLENDDSLLNIIREGVAVGISLVVANTQTSGIGFRYLSNFSNKILLYCNDSNEYISLLDHVKIQPDEVPGRCIIEKDKQILECQTYLAFEGEKEYERVKEIHAFIENVNEKNSDNRATIIPCIPKILPSKTFQDLYKAYIDGYRLPVGLEYKDVAPYYLDMSNLGIIGLCGKGNTGHRNFIKYIYSALESNRSCYPVNVVIFDDVKRKYDFLQSGAITNMYTLEAEKVKDIINKWYEILKSRYNDMLENGVMGENFELLLMIIQNNDVAQIIYDDMDVMDKFTEITSKYKNMGVSFIFADYPNSAISYDAPEPIRMVKQQQHCIFFEDLDNMKPLDIPYEELRANKRHLEKGDAYYILDNQVVKLKMALAD